MDHEANRQAEEIDRQWKLRLDRVHYEALLAERRYKAVDPDNRVVARTLERDWEEKLNEVERTEREHQEIRRLGEGPLFLEVEVDEAIAQLDEDGTGVWLEQDSGEMLRYEEAFAWDADGHPLPLTLDADGESIQILVDDTDAAWPIRWIP